MYMDLLPRLLVIGAAFVTGLIPITILALIVGRVSDDPNI